MRGWLFCAFVSYIFTLFSLTLHHCEAEAETKHISLNSLIRIGKNMPGKDHTRSMYVIKETFGNLGGKIAESYCVRDKNEHI